MTSVGHIALKYSMRNESQANSVSWWKCFSELLRNYLRFSHFSIFWEILEDFSDFFRKFSIVSENYTIRNLICKKKRRKFRFLKNSKKSLPFSPDISYFLRTRWDWETKNSRKIAETTDLKNSVKNLIFSAKNFYFIQIQLNWEHENFEKIWETSRLENSEKISFSLNNSYFLRTQQNWDLVDFEKIKGTSKLGNVGRVSYLSLRQNY